MSEVWLVTIQNLVDIISCIITPLYVAFDVGGVFSLFFCQQSSHRFRRRSIKLIHTSYLNSFADSQVACSVEACWLGSWGLLGHFGVIPQIDGQSQNANQSKAILTLTILMDSVAQEKGELA